MHYLKCVDEPYENFGHFDTEIASNLLIKFDKCDPEVQKCKSQEEIDQWLDRKYILLLENHQSHIQDEIDKTNYIKKESLLTFVPI